MSNQNQKTYQNNKQNKKSGFQQTNKRPYTRRNNNTKKSEKPQSPLKIIALGGLDEIGKNCTVFEYENQIIVVDCGLAFPSADMPGVDIVIPDLSYLVQNQEKIKGVFITHGHEDHIGGIPYLLKQISVPIYATRLTAGLIKEKLKEHSLERSAKIYEQAAGDIVRAGKFSVEFIHVNHSIPNAAALAITTPAGVVVHTGDFKIDTTPLDGKMINISRFAEIGKKGVLAMMSDSTNAERPGYTQSEHTVGESFTALFKKAKNDRIIVATFSSNIHRIQQIVDEAVRNKRKVAVSGRSMLNVVNVATELGYLKIPDGVLIEIETINRYQPNQLVIVTTGSQGEPMSALHRMAHGEHRNVNIGPQDTIIISASPIPGNEKTVADVVNGLMKLGAHVIYEKMYEVHVSGHACQEELKMMLGIVKPKFFLPVHGEQKQLRRHAEMAMQTGIDKKNILINEIGRVVELTPNSMKQTGAVQSGRVLVDGLGVGDVGSIVLRDRKHLAEDGIIIAVMTIESESGEIVSGPDIVSRGFIYVRESEELINRCKKMIEACVYNSYRNGVYEWPVIKNKIKDDLGRYLYEQTKRRPMILPIIMETE
ncbi:MAG: ribonuclease J [Acutalibacteraceae bacterium]|nr:ribonuclease J [Acutalibacteraceae bacterium]